MSDEQPALDTWRQITDHLRQDFEVVAEDQHRIACKVILVLEDDRRVTREVQVHVAAGSLVVDAPVEERAARLGARELIERAAGFGLGGIAGDGGSFVIRHRVLTQWLTPEMLDRCIFGVACDSHSLSEQIAEHIDAAQLFSHYC